MITINYN